jgi:hypothetical protein
VAAGAEPVRRNKFFILFPFHQQLLLSLLPLPLHFFEMFHQVAHHPL